MTFLDDATVERLRRAADAPDLAGTKYAIVREVARGGMGTVYEAWDAELERAVALKIVTVPEAMPEGIARLHREARTLAHLEHPGIVPVHDIGRLADGRLYYAMKLVRGARLDDVAATASRTELLRIFGRICDAIAFAHAHGIVHRDIKPANVMVGGFGEVLVVDWGLATEPFSSRPKSSVVGRQSSAAEQQVSDVRRQTSVPAAPFDARRPTSDVRGRGAPPENHDTTIDPVDHHRSRAPGIDSPPDAARPTPEARAITDPGAILGTPGFMAPEQAAGGAVPVDARADIFALGALLASILETTASPAPRALGAIAALATRADPDERYQSVAALAADVEAFLDKRPVVAYPERALERLRRVAAKYRTPIVLVVAYLVMRLLLLLAMRGRS